MNPQEVIFWFDLLLLLSLSKSKQAILPLLKLSIGSLRMHYSLIVCAAKQLIPMASEFPPIVWDLGMMEFDPLS